jgi:hypothetical protein
MDVTQSTVVVCEDTENAQYRYAHKFRSSVRLLLDGST